MWLDDEDDENGAETADARPLSFGDVVRYALTVALFVAMPWIAGNTPVWLSLTVLGLAIAFNGLKELQKRHNNSTDRS